MRQFYYVFCHTSTHVVLDVVVCRQRGRSGLYAAVTGAHASEARGRNLSKPILGQYVNLV